MVSCREREGEMVFVILVGPTKMGFGLILPELEDDSVVAFS